MQFLGAYIVGGVLDDQKELVELDQAGAVLVHSLYHLVNLFSVLGKAKSNEWILKFNSTDLARQVLIKVIEALAEILLLVLLEIKN